MNAPIPIFRLGILIFMAITAGALGQVASPQPSSQAPPNSTQPVGSTQAAFVAYQAKQLSSFQQQQAVDGTSASQMAALREQIAAQPPGQQMQAGSLAPASASKPQKEGLQPRIPPGSSPAMVTYIKAQVYLANARAHIRNQLLQQATASGTPLTFAQMNLVERKATALFRQKYSAQVSLLAQEGQAIANTSPQMVRPVPAPVVIPANASPQTAAYLTLRSELKRSRIELMNQYATATPAVRDAALLQWSMQNASQIEQMRQDAQSLAQTQTTN